MTRKANLSTSLPLRIVEFALLLAVIVGGVFAWRSGLERSRLQSEHVRLHQRVGELRVVDPSRVYFQALETGEPLHFAWRVYYPANFRQKLKDDTGSTNSSWAGPSQEFIARVRFREDENGVLQVYQSFAGGSGLLSVGDAQFAEWMRNRWDRIQVEQVGAKGRVALAPDATTILLRLSLPADMQAEARTKLTPDNAQRLPNVFSLTLSPGDGRP